ncbi:helix-turn-helix domain-containing protein [Pseudomonas aeruginosa]|uniref:helix-turn-helix domain-containing protein n=1 Tax=Pseudomonas aeruginosa TaxID=287 RepID=UPI0032DE326F
MHDESAMSDVTMAIGENIRKARERKGLRQEQVAEMAGIPLSTYKNYEHGKQPPPGDRIGAIARTLGYQLMNLCSKRASAKLLTSYEPYSRGSKCFHQT